ncbi:FAD dependent oxidoreductase [Fragilaria crotonensis]|nr:FAD dependent oxidoreductase [Fragilaria crotonensis]
MNQNNQITQSNAPNGATSGVSPELQEKERTYLGPENDAPQDGASYLEPVSSHGSQNGMRPDAIPSQGRPPLNNDNKHQFVPELKFQNGNADYQQQLSNGYAQHQHPDHVALQLRIFQQQQQQQQQQGDVGGQRSPQTTTSTSSNNNRNAQQRTSSATPATELPTRQVRFDPNTHTPTPSASSHTRKQQQQQQPRMSRRTQQPPNGAQMMNYSQPRHQQNPQPQPPRKRQSVYDVLIIGGGVVGLAVLRAATLQGYRCVLVEAEADLLRGASSANSGIICTGVDAAIGTLERALIRDSISQIRPFLKTHRIPYRDCGSLVCQWDWDNVGRDKRYNCPLAKVLAESHDAGDLDARKLNANELGNLEPNISPLCVGAVHIPGEIVVDSWLYSIALAAHARENGAQIHTNFEYDAENSWFDEGERVWNVRRKTDKDHLTPAHPPELLRATAVVNATGIVADLVQAATTGVNPPHWRAAPRRGQYRVFLADNYTHITRPIQPVPTQRTKGIFLYSSLYDHIVVGPTAQDQESRFDRRIDPAVADDLTGFALRIIPDLDPNVQHVGEYVGIRPATDYRDYQICMTPQRNWIVAAGIRSTGLTASLGIGRHITTLLQSILPFPTPPRSIRTSPLPSMQELVKHYNSNSEGNVLIHGYLYRVTHPLTQMGFEMRTGIASVARR